MANRYQLAAVIALVIIFSVAAVYDLLAAQAPRPSPMMVDTCSTKMTFSGTQYCSLDVSNFITISTPGYTYMNQSFNFMGVLFQTVCPSNFAGCPGQEPGETITAVTLGVVKLNLTFGDGTNETLTVLLGDACPSSPILTQQHLTPRAGFYLDCVTGSLAGQLKLFILVEAS